MGISNENKPRLLSGQKNHFEVINGERERVRASVSVRARARAERECVSERETERERVSERSLSSRYLFWLEAHQCFTPFLNPTALSGSLCSHSFCFRESNHFEE